jgi:ribosomal protein S12
MATINQVLRLKRISKKKKNKVLALQQNPQKKRNLFKSFYNDT